MSKISFFPLGGMDEGEKPCFVLEVNGDYYVFNVGISIPHFLTLGIKKNLPYIEWIKENKNAIKGIFIGNASFKNIGGLLYIYNQINNIPIYTSKIGASILNAHFNKKVLDSANVNPKPLNIKVLNPLKAFEINKTFFIPFRVTTSVPDSFGFVISNGEDCLVYIDDFVIYNSSNSIFANDIDKLPFLTYKFKNIYLVTSLGNITLNSGFSSPNFKLKNYYSDLISRRNTNRLLVACNYSDYYSFLTLVEIAKEKQIPIIVYNPVFISVFNDLAHAKMIDKSNLLLVPIHKINEISKGIVVLSSTQDRIFNKLFSIADDGDDVLALKNSDELVLGLKADPGFEKKFAEISDAYSRIDIDVHNLPRTYLTMQASEEDHRYLVNLIKPKYIIPTLGKYYHAIKYANVLKEIGFNEDNVIRMFNGEVATFINGNLVPIKDKRVDIHDIYVGSHGVMNEGENIFFERQIMSENGIIFFSLKLNKDVWKFDEEYFLNQSGVVVEDDVNLDILNSISSEAYSLACDLLKTENKKSDIKELKNSVKKLISKRIEKNFDKQPIVITMIS